MHHEMKHFQLALGERLGGEAVHDPVRHARREGRAASAHGPHRGGELFDSTGVEQKTSHAQLQGLANHGLTVVLSDDENIAGASALQRAQSAVDVGDENVRRRANSMLGHHVELARPRQEGVDARANQGNAMRHPHADPRDARGVKSDPLPHLFWQHGARLETLQHLTRS